MKIWSKKTVTAATQSDIEKRVWAAISTGVENMLTELSEEFSANMLNQYVKDYDQDWCADEPLDNDGFDEAVEATTQWLYNNLMANYKK